MINITLVTAKSKAFSQEKYKPLGNKCTKHLKKMEKDVANLYCDARIV